MPSLTPAELEQIKMRLEESVPSGIGGWRTSLEHVHIMIHRDIPRLITALEAAWEARVDLWECPDCGFTFDAIHASVAPDGGYSCPHCAEIRLEAENERLRHVLQDLYEQSGISTHSSAWYEVLGRTEAILRGTEGETDA